MTHALRVLMVVGVLVPALAQAQSYQDLFKRIRTDLDEIHQIQSQKLNDVKKAEQARAQLELKRTNLENLKLELDKKVKNDQSALEGLVAGNSVAERAIEENETEVLKRKQTLAVAEGKFLIAQIKFDRVNHRLNHPDENDPVNGNDYNKAKKEFDDLKSIRDNLKVQFDESLTQIGKNLGTVENIQKGIRITQKKIESQTKAASNAQIEMAKAGDQIVQNSAQQNALKSEIFGLETKLDNTALEGSISAFKGYFKDLGREGDRTDLLLSNAQQLAAQFKIDQAQIKNFELGMDIALEESGHQSISKTVMGKYVNGQIKKAMVSDCARIQLCQIEDVKDKAQEIDKILNAPLPDEARKKKTDQKQKSVSPAPAPKPTQNNSRGADTSI